MKLFIAISFALISSSSSAAMTKRHFIRVLESVEKLYAPIVAEKGGNLVLYQGYQFNTVNALAKQDDGNWIISFYGGLAKYNRLSDDGLRFVVCHELGHHLGGAPFKQTEAGENRWSSAESQADYFATSECLPKVFSTFSDNELIVSKLPVAMRDELERVCGDDIICMRVLSASFNGIDAFNKLRPSPELLSLLDFDPVVVSKTNLEYPSYQCRIDTTSAGYFKSSRPECWYYEN